MTSNLRAAEVKAGVREAELQLRERGGDYGVLVRDDGAWARPATREERDLIAAECARRLDPSASVLIPGVGLCSIEHA